MASRRHPGDTTHRPPRPHSVRHIPGSADAGDDAPQPFSAGTITSTPSLAGSLERLVQAAVEELPGEFRAALAGVSIVISDDGALWHAYGLYQGASVARPSVPAQISIFRDTLLRDFGHDPALFATQVRRVVRHEVGHHLGFDEDGVRRLGL